MAVADWADYKLVAQPTDMLSVYEETPVVEWRGENAWFVDAGREVIGCAMIKAKGSAGSKVRILHGEELAEDGSVRYQMRCNCVYEEFWTLGEGACTLEPYDYKGFRYVQVEADADVEILEMKLCVRHYPMTDSACTLRTDSEIVNGIFEICKNGVRMGTQEAYLDCPTREKGQYLGDAVAPGSFLQEIADFSLMWSELLLTDYEFTGDKEFLGQYYSVTKRILEHFDTYKAENGLLELVTRKWNLVDWPVNLRDDYDFKVVDPIGPGFHNVINALYVGAQKNLTRIEGILGIAASYAGRLLQMSISRHFTGRRPAFWRTASPAAIRLCILVCMHFTMDFFRRIW